MDGGGESGGDAGRDVELTSRGVRGVARSSAEVRKEYARLATRYDLRWASYIEASVRETVARLELRPGERLLDVGCGTGALLDAVCSAPACPDAVGVDITPALLAAAHRRRAGHANACGAVAAADASRLPFPDATFDVVVSTSAFHFFESPRSALAEITRVLRAGGRLVITDWCGDYFLCRACDVALRLVNPTHLPAYRARECEQLLRDAGFVVGRLDKYRISWLWGLMTVVARRVVA